MAWLVFGPWLYSIKDWEVREVWIWGESCWWTHPQLLFLFCPYCDASCLLHTCEPTYAHATNGTNGALPNSVTGIPSHAGTLQPMWTEIPTLHGCTQKSSIGAVAGHWHGIRLWSMIVWAYACLGAVSVVVPVLVCVRAADGCPMCQQCQQGHIQLDLTLPCSSQATLCLGPIPGGLL